MKYMNYTVLRLWLLAAFFSCAYLFGEGKNLEHPSISNISSYTLPALWPVDAPSIEYFAEESDPYDPTKPYQPAYQTRRIYLEPALILKEDDVAILDKNGNWVKDVSIISKDNPAQIYIPVALQDIRRDGIFDLRLMANLKNIRYDGTKVVYPFINGPFIFQPNDLKALDFYLAEYSLEQMAVAEVEFQLRIKNQVVAERDIVGSQISNNSSFALSFELYDPSLLRDFKNGYFEILATFHGRVSTAESGSYIADASALSSALSQQAVNDVQSAKTSSSGFLFFKNSDQSLSQWIDDAATVTTERLINQNKSLVLRDVHTASFKEMLMNYIMPLASKDSLIAAHLAAASDSSLSATVRDAHAAYAKALAAPDPTAPEVNPAVALAALSTGDMAAFLTSGIAFSDSSSSSIYSFRRMRSAKFTAEDSQRISALFLTSVQLVQTISHTPFHELALVCRIQDSSPTLILSALMPAHIRSYLEEDTFKADREAALKAGLPWPPPRPPTLQFPLPKS